MRPLSRLRPKVLLPLGRATLLDHALDRLPPVDHKIVNVHHHREAMERHLRSRVALSLEDQPGLGTAGAVAAAAKLFEGRDVVILNGDTWAPGDLAPVVESWDRERVRVVVAGEARFSPRSRIVASLMPWKAVIELAEEPSGLYEVCWAPRAEAGALDVVGWEGPVIDCATPRDLLAANLAWSGGESVIGEGAQVEGVVERSVVWPGARVWPGEVLVDAIRTDAEVTVLVR